MKEESIILETSEPIRMGFHWPKYRIRIDKTGGYYVQYRVLLFFWRDLETGNFLDGWQRKIFFEIDIAKRAIRELQKSNEVQKRKEPIVYQE